MEADIKQIETTYEDKWSGLELLDEEAEKKRKKNEEIKEEITKENEKLEEIKTKYEELETENQGLKDEIAVLKKEKHTIIAEFKKVAQELISAIRKLEKSIFWIRDKSPTIAENYEEKGRSLYDKALNAMDKLNSREVKRCSEKINQLAEEIDDFDLDL